MKYFTDVTPIKKSTAMHKSPNFNSFYSFDRSIGKNLEVDFF
jgi:hypothetical protein